MFSALRRRALPSPSSPITQQMNTLAATPIFSRHFSSITGGNTAGKVPGLLSLAEVQKVLNDVGADDVRVIPAPERYQLADYMVIATGRSPWHVRNISQALIYKAKQKQKGAKSMLLPSVVGQEGGKWIVIESGPLIVHAVDEKARAYYNFEGLWPYNTSDTEDAQDLEKAFIKVRPKNNSKKKPSQPRT